jgi:hypothetical protein
MNCGLGQGGVGRRTTSRGNAVAGHQHQHRRRVGYRRSTGEVGSRVELAAGRPWAGEGGPVARRGGAQPELVYRAGFPILNPKVSEARKVLEGCGSGGGGTRNCVCGGCRLARRTTPKTTYKLPLWTRKETAKLAARLW